MVTTPNVYAWESPPRPPPPTPHPPSFGPVESITYDNYDPGQVNLEKSRLTALLNEINWVLQATKNNHRTIRKMTIHGFADSIPIEKHDVIFSRLPQSVRPSQSSEVTNRILALGRATSIMLFLKKNLGFRLPTVIDITNTTNLPESPANRRIEVRTYLETTFGIHQ